MVLNQIIREQKVLMADIPGLMINLIGYIFIVHSLNLELEDVDKTLPKRLEMVILRETKELCSVKNLRVKAQVDFSKIVMNL